MPIIPMHKKTDEGEAGENSSKRLSDWETQQLAFVHSPWGCRIQEIGKIFRFPLDELPTIDRGVCMTHPVESAHKPTFRLSDGRVIILTDLHQSMSYEGCLAGMPHPYFAFMAALDTVRLNFPWYDAEPVVLPPIKYTGTYVKGDCRKDWMTVPLVCSIGCFISYSAARDSTKSNSNLVVIWFQDRFGLDLDVRTVNQIQGLDWNVIAWDSEY